MKNVVSISRISLVISLLVVLEACSTVGRGQINPEYQGYRLSDTAVYVSNYSDSGKLLEKTLVRRLKKDGVKAVGVSNLSRFAKNSKAFEKEVWGLGVKEVLAVHMRDSSGANVVGYNTWGSASASTYGGSVTANGESTTTPIVSPHRDMETSATLYNRKDEKVWVGSTHHHASGLLFMSDSRTVSKTADALMGALRKDGLIP